MNKNWRLIIDNTFATPILQRPLELGLDISVHSGTNYLGGHSDLTCGAVVTSKVRSPEDLLENIVGALRRWGDGWVFGVKFWER